MKSCEIIVPILFKEEKKKILFLARFKKNGKLEFVDSDEIIISDDNISKDFI